MSEEEKKQQYINQFLNGEMSLEQLSRILGSVPQESPQRRELTRLAAETFAREVVEVVREVVHITADELYEIASRISARLSGE